MLKSILCTSLVLLLAHQVGKTQVIVNSDGTHSVIAGNVIVNPNGTHSVIAGNVIVNPKGTHSVIAGDVIVNPNGTHSLTTGNALANTSEGFLKPFSPMKSSYFTKRKGTGKSPNGQISNFSTWLKRIFERPVSLL